jgi:aminoglycoside phosphotransferase family enzyme
MGRMSCCVRVLLDVDIARKVAFLASPQAYDERPARVEIVETHFSWVFLTDQHVYKLKKPLRSDGIDFTTLEARRRNAEAEVRLNRRLAADVYLGVVPLTLTGGRALAIGGRGVAADWLVKMVRLPAERMLDRRLVCSDCHYVDVHALAGFLVKFFATARPVPIQPMAYLDRFRAECRASRRAFYSGGSRPLQYAADCVVRYIWAFMARHYGLLLQRVEDRRIIEGHGDLRPEHICLGPAPRIIDCLEFRRDLRCLDPVDELAFLAMECERLGARGIEHVLFRQYWRRTSDCPPPGLIAFYKAIAALIRARIAILHLQETPLRDPAKWPKRAAEYLEIARANAGISMSDGRCGLSGLAYPSPDAPA